MLLFVAGGVVGGERRLAALLLPLPPATRSNGIGVDEELLFVAGGVVGGERRLAALLVVRVVFLGEGFFLVVCESLVACESVFCVSGLLVFVHVELLFVACGFAVVAGELAVAFCGSVLCVSGLSASALVELLFVACGYVVVVLVVGELTVVSRGR